jgi:DNA-binding transcriptional LysR family regulator
MNLRQCEVFRLVVETGSVTEAAGRLHVTQPAVSKLLAQLERDLGFRAFTRERRRLVPTPEGRALYDEVERAFVSLDYLTRFARDLKGLRQGHFVLGAPHGSSSGWLPAVVAGFLRRHPGLSVSLRTMDTPRVAQAVSTGVLDLGIAQFGVAAPQVQRQLLISVEAVCVLPPDHRLVERRIIRPADLRNEAFIAVAPVDRYRVRLDALLDAAVQVRLGRQPVHHGHRDERLVAQIRRPDALLDAEGVPRRVQIDSPLGSTVCALVMEGMGITVVDRLTAEANLHRGIVIRPFAPRIAEDLLLLTPARSPAAITAAFIAELRAHFAIA